MEQSDAAGSNTIGPLMASLYLSLRGGANAEQIDLYAIAEALQACEEHIPDTSRNETAEIVTEIVQDCRKKAAPILRTPFTESLRISVASTRKKLIARQATKILIQDINMEKDISTYSWNFLVVGVTL